MCMMFHVIRIIIIIIKIILAKIIVVTVSVIGQQKRFDLERQEFRV